jgi:hypothetical protein
MGSFGDGASWDELVAGIHEHYEKVHETIPEDVETGATLASGTTIGGNTAFHQGNDGNGSGLVADTVRGNSPSNFASSNHGNEEHSSSFITEAQAPVQSVNSRTGNVTISEISVSYINDGSIFNSVSKSPNGGFGLSLSREGGRLLKDITARFGVSTQSRGGALFESSDGTLDALQAYDLESSQWVTIEDNINFSWNEGGGGNAGKTVFSNCSPIYTNRIRFLFSGESADGGADVSMSLRNNTKSALIRSA